MVTLPMSPGRHRWEWMLHPGEDAAPHLEPAAVRARSSEWLDGERVEIERAVAYTFHAHGRPLAPRPRAAGGRRGAPDAAVRRPGLLVGRARRRPTWPGSSPTSSPAPRGAARLLRARAPPARRRDAAAGDLGSAPSSRRRPPGVRVRDAYLNAIDGTPAAAAGRERQAAADLRRRRLRDQAGTPPHRRTVGSLFPQTDRLDDRLGGWAAVASEARRRALLEAEGLPVADAGPTASGSGGIADLGAAAPRPLRVRLRRAGGRPRRSAGVAAVAPPSA